MESDDNAIAIVNNEEDGQFEIHLEGHTAVLTYRVLANKSIIFMHTETPKPLGGRGLAARLTVHGLEHARENGLAVLPACPYMASYIRDHRDYVELVPEGQRASYGLR